MEINPILVRPVYYSTTVGEAQRLLGIVATIEQSPQGSSSNVAHFRPRMPLSDHEGSVFDYDIALVGIMEHDSQGALLSGRLMPKPGNRQAGISKHNTEYTVHIGRIGRAKRFGQWLLDKTGINLRPPTVDVMVSHANGYNPDGTPIQQPSTVA